jgi:hypothetical protein
MMMNALSPLGFGNPGLGQFNTQQPVPRQTAGFDNSGASLMNPTSLNGASLGSNLSDGLGGSLGNTGTGNISSLTSQQPNFNSLNTLPGTLPPPNPPQAGFDYGGANLVNNFQAFQGMPYVQQVQVAGFTQLGNGQVVQNIQNTPYMPTTVPGSITNLQQLANLPAASSTTLGALLQLGGINPGIISTAGVNRTGALVPPVFGLSI